MPRFLGDIPDTTICRIDAGVFSLVFQACLMPLHHNLTERGLGVKVMGDSLTHIALADETWLFCSTHHNADAMLFELEGAKARETGLLIRWETCTMMDMNPETTRAEPAADADARSMVLHKMTRADRGQCAKMLGATIQIGSEYKGEWIATRQQCWAAFHIRRRGWRLKGFGVE